MIHRFEIVKQVPASAANVIVNYFDLEHLEMHRAFRSVRVVHEGQTSACYLLRLRFLGLPLSSFTYYEFIPPNTIINAARAFFGTVKTTSQITAVAEQPAQTNIHVQVEIDMPKWLYPLRALPEWALRRLNKQLFAEDLAIWSRRQTLFGDGVDDYLSDHNYLLFKQALRQVLRRL